VLTYAPVLGVPRDNSKCMWVVDRDASLHAAGAVLQQWQDGKLRVIEYASRVFKKWLSEITALHAVNSLRSSLL